MSRSHARHAVDAGGAEGALCHEVTLPGGDADGRPGPRVEREEVRLHAVAEDDSVLGHLGDERQRGGRGDLAERDPGRGRLAWPRLADGEVQVAGIPGELDALWGGPETLIVISSDLSHFLPYRSAQTADQDTAQSILDMAGPLTHEQACGGTPVNGLILAAKRHHLRPQLLGLCNSGDTAGDKNRVVGYASFAFMEESRVVH
jgi:hypothetical protein